MKNSVIFVLVVILMHGIELPHQGCLGTEAAQTAPEAESSSSAVVELFDLLDSNKDGYVTTDDLEIISTGTAFKSKSYDYDKMYRAITKASGGKASKDVFKENGWTGDAFSMNLRELNHDENYDQAALKKVLGINKSQALIILNGETEMSPEEVAEFIRSGSKFS